VIRADRQERRGQQRGSAGEKLPAKKIKRRHTRGSENRRQQSHMHFIAAEKFHPVMNDQVIPGGLLSYLLSSPNIFASGRLPK